VRGLARYRTVVPAETRQRAVFDIDLAQLISARFELPDCTA